MAALATLSWSQLLGWCPALGFSALLSVCSRPQRETRRGHHHLFPLLSTPEAERRGRLPCRGDCNHWHFGSLGSFLMENVFIRHFSLKIKRGGASDAKRVGALERGSPEQT